VAAPTLPELLPANEPAEGVPAAANAFTPAGTGEVLDNADERDGKEFFTIVTANDNTFYLVVDRQRDSEHVYFLNTVTEAGLLALAEADVPASPEPAPAPFQTPKTTPKPAPEPTPPQDEKPPKESGGNTGTIIVVVLVALGAGGVGCYIKILKPRKQAQSQGEEDYEDADEEDAGENEYYFDGEDLPGVPDMEDDISCEE
jgi:hypothetical protein